jgi:hypothetical protein
MKPNKALVLFSLYIAPFVAFESLAQLRYADTIGGRGYFSSLFKQESSKLQLHGLHAPNQNNKLQFRYLYDWKQDDSLKTVVFSTDKFGTVQPSSLASVIASRKQYTLFCGGSTTECAFVYEGQRVPDTYSEASGIPAVNAGVSGKDVYGCINSIAYVLKKDINPTLIVIANNVNTLMTFGKEKQNSSSALGDSIRGIKKAFYYLIPGSYHLASSLKARLIKAEQSKQQSKQQSDQPEYEQNLDGGCCHGAASFNRKNPQFNWDDKATQEQYRQYVVNAKDKLLKTLNEYGYRKESVVIFIEPNSFGLQGTASKKDWRQVLTSFGGKEMSIAQSKQVTSVYDAVYANVFREAGFKVLAIPESQLAPNDFYDAVHLTNQGSEKVGLFYASALH